MFSVSKDKKNILNKQQKKYTISLYSRQIKKKLLSTLK